MLELAVGCVKKPFVPANFGNSPSDAADFDEDLDQKSRICIECLEVWPMITRWAVCFESVLREFFPAIGAPPSVEKKDFKVLPGVKNCGTLRFF